MSTKGRGWYPIYTQRVFDINKLLQYRVPIVLYYRNNVRILLCYQQDFGSRYTSPERPQLDDNTSYVRDINYNRYTKLLNLYLVSYGHISREATIRNRNGYYTGS